jgi:hypothetical protein
MAVPPPMCFFLEHGETGQGKLSREKPVGLESRSSAEVVGEIQTSSTGMHSTFQKKFFIF